MYHFIITEKNFNILEILHMEEKTARDTVKQVQALCDFVRTLPNDAHSLFKTGTEVFDDDCWEELMQSQVINHETDDRIRQGYMGVSSMLRAIHYHFILNPLTQYLEKTVKKPPHAEKKFREIITFLNLRSIDYLYDEFMFYPTYDLEFFAPTNFFKPVPPSPESVTPLGAGMMSAPTPVYSGVERSV